MKIKSLALATVLSVLTLQMFADHNTQQRSSCRGLPKYKAVAKVTNPSNITWNNTDTGCGYAHARINSKESNLTNGTDANGNANAESDVYIGTDGFYANGFNYNSWSYGENVNLIKPEFSFAPMIVSKNHMNNNSSKNGYKGDGILFDATNHTVTFKNLTAYLGVSSQDLKNDYTTLQFKIFTETVKDGESTPAKTLWSAKVSIINGELLLEGDFAKNDFANNSSEKGLNYTLNKTTKTIQIDPNIDFETLVVEMSGDGGNLGVGISKNYAPDFTSNEGRAIKNNIIAEANFNFDIINKSKEIEINITKNTINSKIEEASILTSEGKEIKSIELLNNNSSVVNIGDLSNGAYYVRYLIDGNYYLKKFII